MLLGTEILIGSVVTSTITVCVLTKKLKFKYEVWSKNQQVKKHLKEIKEQEDDLFYDMLCETNPVIEKIKIDCV